MEQNNKNKIPNSKEIQGLFNAIIQAVQGEIEDTLFYNYLISTASTSEEKVILSAIKEEELRHSKQLEAIYLDFSGIRIPTNEYDNFPVPNSHQDGITNALFDELRDVVKYRSIRKRLPEGKYKDVLFDIITDELMHASILNYLLTLNSNIKNSFISESSMNRYTTGYHTTSTFTLDEWDNYIIPLVNRAQLEASGNSN